MSLVQLHVYDVTAQHATAIRNFNNFGREAGLGGIFHGGVEVNQLEWSYGYAPSGSGVYSCKPKVNPMYAFRESVALGVTPLSASQVKAAISKLRKKWMGPNYELLTNNCLHFCDELAEALQVPKIPAWLNRMAYGADAVVTFANCVSEQMRWLGSTTSSWWASYMGQPQHSIAGAVSTASAASSSEAADSPHAPHRAPQSHVLDRGRNSGDAGHVRAKRAGSISQLFHVPQQLEALPTEHCSPTSSP